MPVDRPHLLVGEDDDGPGAFLHPLEEMVLKCTDFAEVDGPFSCRDLGVPFESSSHSFPLSC